MTTSSANDPLYNRLKAAAETIYSAHDHTRLRTHLIRVDRDPKRHPSLTGSVYGYCGDGDLVITAYPAHDDAFDTVDGVLVLAIHERDDASRPIRIDGLRAVPEHHVPDPADIAWEFAASPSPRLLQRRPRLVRWDEPDQEEAGLQWAGTMNRDYG